MTATDIDRAVRKLALRQHAAFTAEQARALGASRKFAERRVAREEWEIVGDGVYRLTGAVPSWRQDLQIAVFIAGPGAVVSHRSAAALWRMPGFNAGPIEVLTRHGTTHHRLERGAVHESRRLPAHHTKMIDGLPVTSMARTLCDLASLPWGMHPQRLERAMDNALALRLTTCEELWRVWGDLVSKGRRGVVLLRALLAERLPGYVPPATELEAIFRDVTRAAGIEDAIRQLDIGGDDWIGRIDFTFRRQRVLVEVDGRLGHFSVLDRKRHAVRDKALQDAGWTVLHFTWEDLVSRPQWVVAQLRKELAAAA
jgi:very-short-patch-repair endonuclease